MTDTRFEALARHTQSPRAGQARRMAYDPDARHARGRAVATHLSAGGGTAVGRMSRGGALYQDPNVWRVEDPAQYLLAPSTRVNRRFGQVARAVALLAACCTMTPVLPALMSVA